MSDHAQIDCLPAVARLDGVVKEFAKSGAGGWLRPWRRTRSRVLDGVSLSVLAGRITGLVGVNGSGKTTLLRILCGLLLADAGDVAVLGRDPRYRRAELAQDLGVILPNERGFFWRLTVRRNLEFFSVLNDLERESIAARIEEVAAAVGMSDSLDAPFRDLSDGQKQRIAVARGLLRPSRLLLVDEATRSLDPAGAARIRSLLKKLAREDGVGILIVSHNLDEIAEICDEVALLEDGRIALSGPTADTEPLIRARLLEREASL
jgi:ABC-2 type transport system ATP-binding protein